jgi:hypothetical protein
VTFIHQYFSSIQEFFHAVGARVGPVKSGRRQEIDRIGRGGKSGRGAEGKGNDDPI